MSHHDEATLPVSPGDHSESHAGAVIGRFQTIAPLGTGGMGLVFEGYDPELDRRVAIKVLRPEMWSGDAGATGRVRLQREAQAMAKLSHPNVVAVYEVGRIGDQTFIAMELVDGSTLRGWSSEPRPWREVLAMFVAAGRGLAAAHAAGMVHRDFKPENVLVGKDGRPRVSDFGLVTGESPRFDTPVVGSLTESLTVAGTAVGTPAYMSPEHWAGANVGAKSDQFSFCVALWEGLWRQRPFAGDRAGELRAAVAAGTISRPLAAPAVPGWVETALRRGLSTDPGARWPSMDALLDELEARATPRRPPALLIGFAAAIAAGVAVYAAVPAPARSTACARAADGMAATWNDAVRARVRDALAAVDVPYASASAERATGRLDDYAANWSRMSIESCEATHVRHQQSSELLDRRNLCLEGRRRALSALVGRLAEHPDVATLDAAVKATYALDPLDACADGDRLLAGAAPLPVEMRARADALDAEVAAAHTRFLTGHPKEGWSELEPVLLEIRALDHPQLTAKGLIAGAQLQIEIDALDPAIAALEEAIGQASRGRDDELAARAGILLIKVIGHKQRRFDHANRILPLVAALVARAGNPVVLRARLLQQQGELEDVQSKYEDARGHLEEALALLEPRGAHPDLMGVVNALGMSYANLGRFPEARAALERATALAIALFGPDHPNVGRGLNNLGYLAQQQGDLKAAQDYYQRAFENKQRSLGLDNATTARSLANVGVALAMQGKAVEAVPKIEQAIAIFEKTLGPDHAEVAQNLGNLGSIYGDLRRHDDARAVLQRALAIEIAAYGEVHADVAYVYESIATVEQTGGDAAAAIAAAEKALSIRRAALGDEHPVTGLSWGLLGSVKASSGDCRAAVRAFETGRAIIEKAESATAPHLVGLATEQALCFVALGRGGDAVEVAEAALAIAESNKLTDRRLARAQYGLAAARDAAGTASRAETRALAETALATFRTGGPDKDLMAEVEAWLASHPATR